jgi:hypothetical protein
MVFGKLKAPDIVTMSGALHDPTRRSSWYTDADGRCDRSDGGYHCACEESAHTSHTARTASTSFRSEPASIRGELLPSR